MKAISRITIAALVIIGMALLWQGTGQKQAKQKDEAGPAKTFAGQVPEKSMKTESATAKPTAARGPASSATDLVSLAGMSRTLFQFTRPATGLKALVEYLESTQQEPTVFRDANAYSGEMAIVRTGSPLPGTRYFHAQYFGDGKGDGFVQHMSFEFKPGPNAMADAVQAVQQSFGLGAPKVQRADYAKWALDDGYILWVKKMDASDLQDDPFNAYTDADAGTIRVAIEAEIH